MMYLLIVRKFAQFLMILVIINDVYYLVIIIRIRHARRYPTS